MYDISLVSYVVEEKIRLMVEAFETSFPDLEIHGIRVDVKYSYVSKKLEYGIYADVRDAGQIFLGMSN